MNVSSITSHGAAAIAASRSFAAHAATMSSICSP